MIRSARRRFSSGGPLCFLASLELFTRPAALLVHAANPLFTRGIDEHDQIAQIVPAGLEQDRRIEHDQGTFPPPVRSSRSITARNQARIRG